MGPQRPGPISSDSSFTTTLMTGSHFCHLSLHLMTTSLRPRLFPPLPLCDGYTVPLSAFTLLQQPLVARQWLPATLCSCSAPRAFALLSRGCPQVTMGVQCFPEGLSTTPSTPHPTCLHPGVRPSQEGSLCLGMKGPSCLLCEHLSSSPSPAKAIFPASASWGLCCTE